MELEVKKMIVYALLLVTESNIGQKKVPCSNQNCKKWRYSRL